MFVVQCKTSARGAWKAIGFTRPFATLEDAIARAKGLDPDGIITPDVRIWSTDTNEVVKVDRGY